MKNHCWKCGGTGILPEYSGIKNGVCFACGGLKTKSAEEFKAEKIQKKKDNAAWKQKQNEIYELKGKINSSEKIYKDLQAAVLDDMDNLQEEEIKILGAMIKRKFKALQEMKNHLKELEK
jgi:hypothetical protein